ncbi:MAG TPA: PIN domain-containing protein [Nitrolancea sp.]|nr:PIN domain-containing protein [Nitrolancea sp.]
MTAFLLDTSVIVEFSKQREPAYSQIIAWIRLGESLAVCAVSVAEFYAGLSIAEAYRWEEMIAAFAYWPISRSAAMHAGQERYSYARRAKAISTTDSLLAAVARERHAILVTNNVEDFPMDDLVLFPLLG